MEKYGISNEELKAELQERYTALVEKKNSLVKTGSAVSTDLLVEIESVKAKIELCDVL